MYRNREQKALKDNLGEGTQDQKTKLESHGGHLSFPTAQNNLISLHFDIFL